MKHEQKSIVPIKEEDDLYYKIMLIGGKGVGKTQIIKRFCKEVFEEHYYPTFGIDFRIQKSLIDNITITIQIIEVSGKNPPPMELLQDYIIDTDCFICVYDISKRESINDLKKLISTYEKIIDKDSKKCWYFAGNKKDILIRECLNNIVDNFEYTPSGTFGFSEISAKENKLIKDMFKKSIQQIRVIKRLNNDNNDKANNTNTINLQPIINSKNTNDNEQDINDKSNKSKCIII